MDGPARQKTHVVIGDGATAAAFVARAALRAGDRLVVVGEGVADLGRGLAYRDHPADAPWRYAYLLNSPNEVVKAPFAEWVAAQWSEIAATMHRYQPRWLDFGAEHIAAKDYGALFAPRALFGDWVAAQTREALGKLSRGGVRVDLKPTRVCALRVAEDGFTLDLATGERLLADGVDVATGGAQNQAFDGAAGPGLFPALYGFEDQIAAALRPGVQVTCLGGNAAMLDVLRFLQSVQAEQDIRLCVINRSHVPEPLRLHRPRKAPVRPEIAGPFETAAACLEAVDAEIARFRAAGAQMSELRSGFSAWLDATPLDRILPERVEQRRLQRRLEGRFRRGTHDSLADYARLVAAGQIAGIAGAVQAVDAQARGGVQVIYRAEGREQRLRSEIVINTSGPRNPLALEPLARDLLDAGLLRANPEQTGIVVCAGLHGEVPGLRYLSPAVTEIGTRVLPLPLYDVSKLWGAVDAAQDVVAG